MPKELYWAGIAFGVILMLYGLWLLLWPLRVEKIDLSSVDLQLIPRDRLRERAIELANEVRAAEARANAAGTAELLSGNHQTWRTHRERFELEYRTAYRSDLLALCNEMARRLHLFPPYRDRPNALDDAMFAGPHPATEAADYVESLARRLG